ncbi:MAG: hypothetical protein LBH72_01090 [Proteiniphilum sp.]|jgi:hypothetical protein|nr:hypothetical protein [Proteiniphilum sp.]
MEVNFTLWSLKGVLEQIPFDSPAEGPVHLDFSDISVPHYIKDVFKVSIIYSDEIPFEACCCIYSPRSVVTIIIILKKQYEDAFTKRDDIKQCCVRRELYCHETCHLIAIIRAFPSERSSMAREDFIEKIKEKFEKSVKNAEELKMVSMEPIGVSPSVFDKGHFNYGNDSLNYFKLYQELIFSHDKMVLTLNALLEKKDWNINGITFSDVENEAFVPAAFFNIFPEKLTDFKKFLVEEMKKG